MQAPVVVINTGNRETGRKAQVSNITAATAVADIVRTCLGPKAMLKMLLDPVGGIVLTNDGHAILREIDVTHPAAKSMIELSRSQDEEVGDGTTSVIILAGEVLNHSKKYIDQNIHPVVIIKALREALKDALEIVNEVSIDVDINDDKRMLSIIQSSIGTKYVAHWSDHMCRLALTAVRSVQKIDGDRKEIDIKRFVRVEKIPGDDVLKSQAVAGVVLNKDITHPKMRRQISNPKVMLLDCPLEYKKGESQTNIEITDQREWSRVLEIEEEQIKKVCETIASFKPDLVITEKGVSDLAQHYLLKHNITALRRVRKTDNNRIARVTGATIVNRVEDLKDHDLGTCGEFKVELIGDEYYSFLTDGKPGASTILLRGPSKDILNEIERNLQDAMSVARNVMFEPRLSPGGGATEMAVSVRLAEKAKGIHGVEQWPYQVLGDALEVIPRTLVQNCGGNALRTVTALRAKHAEGGDNSTFGINGDNASIVDMRQYRVWEPEAVKLQSIKTAVESACLLLRVDDIVSAKRKDGADGVPPNMAAAAAGQGMGGMPGMPGM